MSSYTIPSVIERTQQGGERVTDVFSRLLSDRIIYLGTAVDAGVANTVIAQVLHLESVAPELPIQLFLNSSGGDLSAVLAIYDTLQYVHCDISVTCVGEVIAASAALLAAGTRGMRAVLPHTRVVLRPLEASARGAIPDLILASEEVERLRRQLEGVIAAHSGQNEETVRRHLERERVLGAQEAVDYGLADRVLFTRPLAAGR